MNTHKYTYGHILKSALAENTRIAYEKGWRQFCNFCAKHGFGVMPATPRTVIKFLIDQATNSVSAKGKPLSMGTIVLYHSAISRKHTDNGFSSPSHDPEVISVLRGLKRLRGTTLRRVRALSDREILQMIKVCGKTPLGLRDAAIISIGFASALRRSEICNLKVEDIEIIDSAASSRMLVHIRKSKTDQQGIGQAIAVPEGNRIKPIQRIRDWLKVSGISSGYLFQTMKRGGRIRGNQLHHSDIPRIIKHYAGLIGLDPSGVAGHSLRAGFVTCAAVHHARMDKIMEVTRHRNPSTVLQYIRDANVFSNHAGEKFL